MRDGKSISLALLALALALFATQSPAWAEEAARDDTLKCIVALKCNCGIKIDGIIDELIWESAPRSGGFIQYQPDGGKPASESTFVRVAYDDEALFIAMEIYDSEPGKIVSRLTRRDRWVEGDLVHVIIDSYHCHPTAYAFTLYASGTQRDVYYCNDTWSDSDWDAVWEGRTRIADWGWPAEYKIPFHCLRFSCEDNPVWGIYFSRSVSRKNELDRWLHIPESAPDFGQVEADQTVLNLSTFETWYPEKRPFFLEGSKIFDTYYSLFYSRRIGRPPSIWPGGVDYYMDRPAATAILAAAKVTGKTAGGTSIGILESMTQREVARLVDRDGDEREVVIEPRANYLVGRVKQDVLRNSEVGLMVTAVNQRDLDAHYTGGLDWNLRLQEGEYKGAWQVVVSHTGPEEQGWGGVLVLEKSGGEHWRGSLRGNYNNSFELTNYWSLGGGTWGGL